MVSAALDFRPIDPDINRRIDIHNGVYNEQRVVCSFRKMGRWRGKQGPVEQPISSGSGVGCFSHLPLLFPCYFTKIILPRPNMFNLNIIATVDILPWVTRPFSLINEHSPIIIYIYYSAASILFNSFRNRKNYYLIEKTTFLQLFAITFRL